MLYQDIKSLSNRRNAIAGTAQLFQNRTAVRTFSTLRKLADTRFLVDIYSNTCTQKFSGTMNFASIFHTILLLGALQGFILSGLLFRAQKNRRANRYLAWVMLLLGLCNCYLWMSNTNFGTPWVGFLMNFIPGIMVMPVGPLVYFYIRASVETDFHLSKKQRWHFAPVIIDWGSQLMAFTFVGGLILHVWPNQPAAWGQAIDTYNVYSDIPRWMSLSIYLWISFRYIAAQTQMDASRRRWFQNFLKCFGAFQLIWLCYLVPYVIPATTDFMLNTFDWYPVYIPMVVLIYTLGIKGYLLPAQMPVLVKKTTPPPQQVVQEAMPLLQKAMEQDKHYLDPELDLALLARHTGLAPKTISAVLNQHAQQSFSEFVNGYRVAAFRQKVSEAAFAQMTIMGMAYECGFNSQATFQRCFKQVTGVSPREYIHQYSGRNSQSIEN